MLRNRFLYFALILFTIGLGLLSRRITAAPQWVHLYLGDILWSLMVFWGAGFLLRRKNTVYVAGVTVLFSVLIELSQLYHASWIEAIRSTTIGGLVLGFGFLWSDIICYTIGAVTGLAFELLFYRK